MYKEVVDKAGIKQSVEKTSRIATYELGNVHKLLIYIEQFGPSGYLGELEHECSDLYTMVCLLCEQLGYDLEEIKDIGFERFQHRVEEVRKKELERKFGDK